MQGRLIRAAARKRTGSPSSLYARHPLQHPTTPCTIANRFLPWRQSSTNTRHAVEHLQAAFSATSTASVCRAVTQRECGVRLHRIPAFANALVLFNRVFRSLQLRDCGIAFLLRALRCEHLVIELVGEEPFAQLSLRFSCSSLQKNFRDGGV